MLVVQLPVDQDLLLDFSFRASLLLKLLLLLLSKVLDGIRAGVSGSTVAPLEGVIVITWLTVAADERVLGHVNNLASQLSTNLNNCPF